MNVKCVMPWTTNGLAVILLHMSVFEKEKQCIFGVSCFLMYIYFLGYQIGLKSVYFRFRV